MFSISFGVICGLCFKGDVHQRGNKATSLIMISVFLSGEMISQLPGLFEKYFPIFNKINPATVLNMALFKLTIGNSAEGFFTNIAEIIGLTVVFLAIGIAVLRREKYASV
jgi:ABC-2 type transport system permease protein